jgi:hypothetical protein
MANHRENQYSSDFDDFFSFGIPEIEEIHVDEDTVFQKYVKSEHGKELSLLLDCKTRWHSLLTMLERFALLKASIQKALIDLNHPVRLEDSDFDLINEIIDVLVPVKLTVDALGRRDANLCTADAALKFLFKQLNEKKINTRK